MTLALTRRPLAGGIGGFLRGAALIAALAGAAGSLAFMFYAGRHQKSLVLFLLFAAWVASPFIAMVLANLFSQRWPIPAQPLNVTILLLTPASLAVYGCVAFGYTGAKIGFVFLIVPLASWLLITIVVLTGTFIARRRPR